MRPDKIHASGNLPSEVSTFIGREQELCEIRDLLRQRRLVTLTGAGGAGKTRLALRAAADEVDHFAGGVWLAELAPLVTPELVIETIILAVGAPKVSVAPPLETLRAFLAAKELLLVLDNCEHLLAECARVVADLLARCPALRLLVTSREPLAIAGEWMLRVPPLRVPGPSQPLDVARLLEYDSIRLFAERAQAAEPSFHLTSVSAPPVVEICRRLDGIPLALELAAVRVRGMGVAYLGARLDDRFRLLRDGDRAGEPRQRTLLALIDWSYDLLSESEQVVLRRLGVLVGSFALEAVEIVCAGDYAGDHRVRDGHATIASDAVLDSLLRLVDKSLVQFDQEAARYRLLETIRLYALERLTAAGELEYITRQHFAAYLQLVQDGAGLVGGPDQATWFSRLDQEHDNLRAALAWAIQAGRGDEAARLALGLWQFWRAHTYQREGLRWLEQIRALDAVSPLSAPLRPRLFNALGVLAHMVCYFDRARAYHDEALRLWTAAGDRAGMAQALIDKGWQHFQEMELAQAKQCAVESLPLAEHSGDQRLIASALFLDAVADLHSDLGLMFGYGTGTKMDPSPLLGVVPTLERSLTTWRELGDIGSEASTLALLGLAYQRVGDYERAKPVLAESARLHLRLGDYGNITGTLVALMNLAAYASDAPESARDAARIFGVLMTLAGSIAAEPSPWATAEPARRLTEKLGGVLGQEGFEQAFAEGQGLTTAELLALVDRITAPGPRDAVMPSTRVALAIASHDELTSRELEVLRLVAQGLTNAQVAERLTVTPRTVNAHLTSIYSKLGATSRAGAIRYALDHHLS
jgi:non-specific serine/threonine protein kinase